VNLEWTSSVPQLISNEGLYNPAGYDENTPVELTIKEWIGDYYWTHTYNVNAQKDSIPDVDYKSGMLAYYNFDDVPVENKLNTSQTASLRRSGTTASRPQLETNRMRNGQVIHQYSANESNRHSYAEMPNPLLNADTSEGVSIAFWVHPNDDNIWNTIFSFYDSSIRNRLWVTPNAFLGYTTLEDTIYINYPERVTNYITPNQWNYIVLTVSPTGGATFYVNGGLKTSTSYSYQGRVGDTVITRKSLVDFKILTDFMGASEKFYLGYGSTWTSADMLLDDLMIYNRVLTSREIRGLYMLANRVYDFASDLTSGIEDVEVAKSKQTSECVYDLSGRKIADTASELQSLPKGLYIVNGRKVVVK